MELSRRQFVVGTAALATAASAPVVLAGVAPRVPTTLEGHKTWELVRPHVLGHLSIDEMATGLPGPWQEFLASWRVEGPVLYLPILHRETPIDSDTFLGARLKSGYEMHLNEKCWAPFFEKWITEVCVPLYGRAIYTKLGPAILTNIHLFRMAYKYQQYQQPKS